MWCCAVHILYAKQAYQHTTLSNITTFKVLMHYFFHFHALRHIFSGDALFLRLLKLNNDVIFCGNNVSERNCIQFIGPYSVLASLTLLAWIGSFAYAMSGRVAWNWELMYKVSDPCWSHCVQMGLRLSIGFHCNIYL